MSSGLKFDHLTYGDFEQLCYDLLRELGAIRLNWRKGTPANASPADQGRDIECEFEYPIPGGERLTERRFIECKHYSKGVPAEALAGALSWAMTERPDSLYFLISGFLSNSAKLSLEAFQLNNRPPFRIIVWERPDLEVRLESHSRLIIKYGLAERPPQLNLLHPAHLEFIMHAPIRRLETLFRILDEIDPQVREGFLGWVMDPIILPRYREPKSGNEIIADLRLDPVNYVVWKQKCCEIKIEDFLLVHSIISFSLDGHFRIGDYTRGDELKSNLQRFIEFLEKRIEDGAENPKALVRLIERSKAELAVVDERVKANYARYLAFCQYVVRPLLDSREPFDFEAARPRPSNRAL